MPLNPLQNAVPTQQIPKEAPSYFSPFFPQAPKATEEISIWKPPPTANEPHLRSKAPKNQPSTPPQIPTVGATSIYYSKQNSFSKSKNNSIDDGRAQLYQPKVKKSLDEIMWLGSVSGFPVPAPPPPKVEPTIRTKLARKPEAKSSAACLNANGYVMQRNLPPKDTRTKEQKKADEEAEKKRKEDEEARRKRLAAHSKKAGEVKNNQAEQRVRPSGRRGKVFLPIPLPQETAQRSNRPNANHRPNLPENDTSYAPSNPFLPQPIETTRRSNRRSEKPEKPKVENEEESVWMGLPQPIETVRRSNRKKPMGSGGSGGSVDNKDGKDDTKVTPIEILPEPIESSRRSHRPRKSQESALPQPEETTGRSNRPTAAPLQKVERDPSTPTTSFFGPNIAPQPYETTKRSHRPISARPLIPQPIETSRRSNRIRVPQPEMHLEIEAQETPQPVTLSSHSGHHYLRRNSTTKPNTPSLYPGPGTFVRDRERERRLMRKVWARPNDHVSHLHEPVDSVPPSPIGSPEQSRCPSLSTSPTSSAASSTWEVSNKLNKTVGTKAARRGSGEDGFGPYILGLEKDLRKEGAIGSAGIKRERAKEEVEHPFPVVTEDKGSEDKKPKGATDGSGIRSERSETVRPLFTSAITDGVLEIKHPQPRRASDGKAADDYPICHSPVHGKFTVPWGKKEGQIEERGGFNNSRVPTDELDGPAPLNINTTNVNTQLPTPPDSLPSSVSNKQFLGGPRTAPPRVIYTPMAPSPGYTVASLPPRRKDDNDVEVTEEFINAVVTYLSLHFESIAAKYDTELALYTNTSEAQVKSDRRGAVRKYVERWITENPEMASGEGRKGGFW
ncbi:hypothetical protein L873DRAFT_1826794 [Choiromyces venosus 120613-1]|uniref:Uncharacterized protein n=1 Tax=Choiromyces venosus 120613-1 TaxID=1336337 RepID=A0A3N4JVP5_9PEZI|nr:hypothetical protein L873DRAFT_1826794 [Choiromyces venosus 120613-1]